MGEKVEVEYLYSVESPLNREPEVEKLVSSFYTEDGYDRNHGPIPLIDASTHRVKIDGLVHMERSLSIRDLEKGLVQHSVVCALQCAGNRRHTMRTKIKEVSGIDWFDGAVMNCIWTGPLLCDVLKVAGTISTDQYDHVHVAFGCHSTKVQEDDWYGASIPYHIAMDPSRGVILALEMNGSPLSPKHGAPVRVITPGIAGARSVKWLDTITIQPKESTNYYQRHDYKILPSDVDSAEKAEQWWDKVPALGDMPINSVIAVPLSNSTVRTEADEHHDGGMVEVTGYALPSGSNGPIVKVEVSADEGKTWWEAQLLDNDTTQLLEGVSRNVGELKWAWCRWKKWMRVERGKDKKIWSRATDASGNVQKESCDWNLRGVAYNGYGEASGLEIV